MSSIADAHRSPRFASFELERRPTPGNPLQCALECRFDAMESVYVREGGLATGDAVAELLRARSSQPISVLARWIVDRRIVSFNWQSRLLIPLFQFDMATMEPRQCVLDAVGELSPHLDDWDLASWFVEPNAWLDGRQPIDVVDDEPAELVQAARADRQIARW